MKTNFHDKNFALSLTFIMRFKATRKWSIDPHQSAAMLSLGGIKLYVFTRQALARREFSARLAEQILFIFILAAGIPIFNRPFSSCCEPHYESEAECKIFLMKISFVCI